MFRNYFIVALRNFRRNKVYTLINILGLALGITCAMLVYMLVNLHLSYDTFHEKSDRIYRVTTDLYFEAEMHTPGCPVPMGNVMREEFPQIEAMAEYFDMEEIMITVEELNEKKKYQFDELEGAYVGSTFFDLFDFKWLSGSPSSLDEPNKVALRKKTAELLFEDIDPIGQQIRINNEFDVTVVGVLEDEPENSDYWRAAYVSFPTYVADNEDRMTEWGSVSSSQLLFALLKEETTKKAVDDQLVSLVEKYHKDDAGKAPDGGNAWKHKLQPLSDIHFNGEYGGDVEKPMIYAIALVGLFLILTACINFINLATAQALGRSKEVGIRKVVGGSRNQLFGQFMLETGAIVFISIVLAAALVNPVLPFINDLTDSNLTFNLIKDSHLLVFLVAMLFGVTILSGIYPALVLAGFKPALAVKGKITTQTLGGFNVRRALVVAQFAISQLLIIVVAVMTMQTDFLKKMDLGFNKDAVVSVNLPDGDMQKLKTLRTQLQNVRGVEKISFSWTTASSSNHNWTSFVYDQREEAEQSQILIRPADSHFTDVYEIPLVAGRNLMESDTVREFLVTEEFITKMEIPTPEDALGKMLRVWGKQGVIVGVMKNHYQSPANYQGFAPMAISTYGGRYRNANIKISNADVPGTLAGIEKVWSSSFPDNYYDYQFFDERVEGYYELEEILLSLIRGFCMVAIFIGCLGLYGLVTFLVARRLKEVGVRKVLGASITSILGLFGKEFVRLIIIAFIIAAPLGYFAMDAFLADYENAINLSWGIFIGAILLSTLIAAITVGWHSWKAANSNPSEVLKSE